MHVECQHSACKFRANRFFLFLSVRSDFVVDTNPVTVRQRVMANNETYRPNARDSVVAYFGLTAAKHWRTCCVCCNDATPLEDAGKIYGDLYVASGPCSRVEDGEQCDVCGVSILALSQACQAEHDEQQARWSRAARPDHVIEYGMPNAIRCRVY